MVWVVSAVFLLEASTTTAGVVLIDPLKWLIRFIMAHQLAMGHIVLDQVSRFSMPS